MTKSVAFVFHQVPHGSSAGREGLDAVLATATLSEQVALFFIGDGVMQLIAGQQPDKILSRHYSVAFGLLSLYDIEACYVCAESLSIRGLSQSSVTLLPASFVHKEVLREQLEKYDHILTF